MVNENQDKRMGCGGVEIGKMVQAMSNSRREWGAARHTRRLQSHGLLVYVDVLLRF